MNNHPLNRIRIAVSITAIVLCALRAIAYGSNINALFFYFLAVTNAVLLLLTL